MERPKLKKRTSNGSEDGGGAYFAAPSDALTFIPSGSKLLDCVIGGGWPLGRVSNIVGDKSTGKTLLAVEASANFARLFPEPRNKIWYNEAEAAFDTAYAKTVGLPTGRVKMVENCHTVEDFFEHLDKVAKALPDNAAGLYILDSLDALSDRAEMGRGIDEGSYGTAKAKKMSELFRRSVKNLKDSRIHLMIISQVRDVIGVAFGEKHKRTGGRALDFYASQVLYLAQIGTHSSTIKKVKRVTGVEVRAKCKKNKIALPHRECEFSIRFGYGVDDIKASLAWLHEIGTPTVAFEKRLERAETVEQEQRIRSEVDELVVANWYRIEKQFLPTRGKYE